VRLECGDGAAQVPPGARIQTDLPGGAKDVDAGRGAALRELAALLGDERLLDLDIAPELAGEQPDLLLAAAPVAARIDLENAHRPGLRRGLSRLRRGRDAVHRV